MSRLAESLRVALLVLFCGASAFHASAQQPKWTDYYSFEKVTLPETVDPQIGGLITLSDGRIAACFYSGEVLIYGGKGSDGWTEFARGLMCPLGLLQEPSGSILVMQWSELTRLSDTDGDGKADFYQSVCDDFGITGNYHEFAFGPARDEEGNLYVALNVASNNGGVFKNVRGPWSEIGLEKEHMDEFNGRKIADEHKRAAGRMFSRVPYRGWVLKITPDGTTVPFASGFRSPDGIGFDDEGRLWVTDNQGDWKGTSPLYHVEEGNFYGHPASLIWREGWDGRDPLDLPVEELETMRTREAGLFPYGDMANSPTQPFSTIDPGLFGLPEGELLIGDMNQPNLIRFLPQEIEGTMQGAAISFLATPELGIGNHRFTFAHDGSLWIGKAHLKWAGDEGITRVVWKKEPMFLIKKVRLLRKGFEIVFSQPVDKEVTTKLSISRHTYHYNSEYGSPKVDLQEEAPTDVVVGDGGLVIRFSLPEIRENYLYNISFENIQSVDGNPLMGSVAHYFVHRTVSPDR